PNQHRRPASTAVSGRASGRVRAGENARVTDAPDTTQPLPAAHEPAVLPIIAFHEPRIPQNTGNAIRLAAVTGAPLHLVEPLGFDLSEPKLRRAGLDYHDLAHVVVHPDLEHLLASAPDARVFAFTTKATTRYTDITYTASDILLFGPEPTGLDD